MSETISRQPIAIFDSGLGGLTVTAAIHRLLAGEDLIFLADRARVPYASLSDALIAKFAGECFDYLIAQNPKVVVIACNTVSAVALPELAGKSPVPVIGVIEATAREAARLTRNHRIGVIATTATVKRRAYDDALANLVPDVMVSSNGCPLLVPLVEEGWTEGEIPSRIVEHYLEPLRPADVDTLVMGCTHYEYFRETIQRTLGDQVALVNTPEATALEVRALLEQKAILNRQRQPARVRICSSDVTDALHRVTADLFRDSMASGRVTIESVQIPVLPVNDRR